MSGQGMPPMPDLGLPEAQRMEKYHHAKGMYDMNARQAAANAYVSPIPVPPSTGGSMPYVPVARSYRTQPSGGTGRSKLKMLIFVLVVGGMSYELSHPSFLSRLATSLLAPSPRDAAADRAAANQRQRERKETMDAAVSGFMMDQRQVWASVGLAEPDFTGHRHERAADAAQGAALRQYPPEPRAPFEDSVSLGNRFPALVDAMAKRTDEMLAVTKKPTFDVSTLRTMAFCEWVSEAEVQLLDVATRKKIFGTPANDMKSGFSFRYYEALAGNDPVFPDSPIRSFLWSDASQMRHGPTVRQCAQTFRLSHRT